MKNLVTEKVNDNKLKYLKWLIWGCMVLSYVFTFFHSLSMGVVKDYIIKDFGINDVTFVSMGNVFFYVYLLMQIPTGLLVDTYGSKKVAVTGSLFAGIGAILFSYATSFKVLVTGRALIGLGTAVIFVAILKIISNWFREEEFGTMIGITCFLGYMGGVLAQSPLATLIENIGWRSTLRTVGVLSIIIGFLISFVVSNRPEDIGLRSPNAHSLNNQIKPNKKEVFIGLWKVISNPRTWPIMIVFAGFYGTYVIMMGYYGTSFISDLFGKSTIEASKVISFGVIGSAVGAISIGKISDYVQSRKKPLIVVGSIYVLIWAYIVYFLDSSLHSNLLAPLMFMVGFTSCAYVISWPAAKEVNNPKYIGVSTAVANIGGFIGTIILPALLANVFEANRLETDLSMVYSKAFTVALIAAIISLIMAFFVKETQCKNTYVEKEIKLKTS